MGDNVWHIAARPGWDEAVEEPGKGAEGRHIGRGERAKKSAASVHYEYY